MQQLIRNIEQWATDRDLFTRSTPERQFIKTIEELGELADGLNSNNLDEIKDGIGDVVVTLIILAKHKGVTFEECVEAAYNEIANRKGTTVNGIFVKEAR